MLLGLLQNDASLLSCRLAQLRKILHFELDYAPDAVGAGYVENGEALLRRRPGSAPVLAGDVLDLVRDVKATGLILHVRRATVGAFKDENTHPFRFKNWLMAHSGTVSAFGDLRPALLEDLPEFLQRSIAGETDSEHVFAIFLDEMLKAGSLESFTPEPEAMARAVSATIERVEALCRRVGATAPSTLNLVATNGRGMVACRHDDGRSLGFVELGGLSTCELHGLDDGAAETHAQRVPHHNLRSVAVTNRAREEAGAAWSTLRPGQILAVGASLTPSLFDV